MSDELKPWEQAAKNKNISNKDIKPWEQAATLKKKEKTIVSSTPTSKQSELGGMTDLSGIASKQIDTTIPTPLTYSGGSEYIKEQLQPKIRKTQPILGRDYLGNKKGESKIERGISEAFLPNAPKEFNVNEFNPDLEGIGAPVLPSNKELGKSEGIADSKEVDLSQPKGLQEATQAYRQAKGEKAFSVIQNIDQIKEEQKAKNKIGGAGDSFMAGVAGVNKSLAKIPRFIYGLGAVPQNAAAYMLNKPELQANYNEVLEANGYQSPLSVIDRLGDIAAGQEDKYNARVKKYDDDIVGSISKGNFADAGAQVVNNIAGSIPSMILMATTGGIGNAAKLGYYEKTLLNALPFASGKMQELSEDTTIPEYIKPVTATLNGLAEVIFDQKFGTQAAINNIVKLFKEGGKEAADVAAKEFTEGYIKKALSQLGAAGKSISKGSLEEATTQFAQNISDKYTINPDKNLMDDVANAAITGGLTTGGVEIGGKMLAGRYNKNQKKELTTLAQQRSDIIDDLDKDNVSEEVKNTLKDALDVVEAKIEGITEDAEAEVDIMPSQVQGVVTEKQREIESLSNQLQDENISPITKQVITDKIKALEAEVNNIIDNANKPQSQQEIRKAELLAELESITDDNNPRIAEIDAELEQLENIKQQQENAVQIETAGQVPVQPEARVGEEVEQGKPQPEVEGVTEEGGKEEVVAEAPKKQGVSREVTDLDIAKSNLKFAEIAKKEATEYLKRYKNNPFADKVSFNKAKLADANKKIKKLNQDISKLSEVKPAEVETKPILYVYNGEKVISEEDLVTKQGVKYKRLTFENGKNLLIKEKDYAALEKQKEATTEAPQQTVEQLRAQEQAEYAAMANPKDKVERQKIYDKYDKLITPLIREAKQEVATKELIDAQNKLKRAKSEASKNRLIQEVEKLSTPEQFKQFIQDNPEVAKNLPKQEETVSAPPISEELEVEGEVETPSEAKRREIEQRQKELLNNIRKKLGNISAGFNPDIIPDLIKLGATYIELGAVNFKDFAEQIKAAYGSDIPEDNLRDIFDKSAKSLGKGIRKLPTRIAADEGLSPELRKIANEADAVYQRQNYDDIQETLDNMSEADKNGIVGALENATGELSQEGNIGVLAAIDLINKYEAAGDKANANRIFDIVSKSSTVFAQLLRQYGQLKSSTVQGFLSLIEKDMLKKYGVQITDAQKADITKLYEDIKSKTEAAKQALENHIKDLTNKTQKDLGKADIELENSVRLFNDYLDKLKPKTWKGLVDKMIAITQGDLLTLKSLVVNLLANIIQYGNKFASNEVANLLDLVISTVKSTPRTRISGFNSDALRLSGKSAFSGLKAANRSLLRGATATEISKYDVSGRLKPVEAWKSLWQTLKGKKQITAPGVLTDLLEGIPGALANLALRLLPYGDLPRNQMAKTYKLVEIGITKFNLKGKDLDRFILNPDKESLAIAEDYGDRATLQNKTLFYDLINKGIAQFDAPSDSKATAGLKSLGKFITRGLIVPFLKTPINAAVMAFRLSNPIVPLGQAGIEFGKIIEYRKGKNVDIKNKKISESQHKITGYLGEAIVAQVILMSAVMLVKYGLTSGGVPDKDKKERDFMFQTFGPNQINISGLKRLISGGDPTFKQGDVAISYMPMGLLGAQLGVVTEGYKQREKEAEKQSKVKTAEGKPFYSTAWDANKELGNAVTENLPASAKYMLDQGFVQGTSAILDAVSKNDYDRWSSQWVKTFTTGLAMPNTIVQTLRASNEFMTNTFDDDQVKNIANTVKNLYGDTEDLPIRYDMWGKKILQTPKGENPYVYHIIDIFRSQQLLQDKDTYNVFLLYKKTGDRSVIPSSVSDIVEESRSDFKIKLTPQQTADLQRIVGEERLKRIKKRTPFNINNNKPDYLEQEVAGYKRAYENGLSAGKRRFKTEVLDKVKK